MAGLDRELIDEILEIGRLRVKRLDPLAEIRLEATIYCEGVRAVTQTTRIYTARGLAWLESRVHSCMNLAIKWGS
jgi:hypothetical protein